MTIPKNENQGIYHYESGAAKICGRFQIVAGPVMVLGSVTALRLLEPASVTI